NQLRTFLETAAGFGITSIQLMPTTSGDRFVRLLSRLDLPVRVRAMPFSITNAGGRDLTEIDSMAKFRSTNAMLTENGIKWILDGTPFEHGAAMLHPYADAPN